MLEPSVRERKFLSGSGGGTKGVVEFGHGHPGGKWAPQDGQVVFVAEHVELGLQYCCGGGSVE